MSAQRCATEGCGNYSDTDKCPACVSGYVLRTADRVPITNGLAVWTNDLEVGTVDLGYSDRRQDGWPPKGEFWFYVQVPGESRPVQQSETRVSTVHPFTGQRAADAL